mmetsp:Transcript_51040/g.111822  ORF Transcript_51040/g.111822 Transcript_51040/m.111822 type:complete len:276 (-) Transcript_51040:1476-2303(-)
MSNVRHARSNEYLIHLSPRLLGQQLRIVGIIRAAHNGLRDLVHVDHQSLAVLRTWVGTHQLGIGEPLLHPRNATQQSARIAVAFRHHPLQQHNVTLQVLSHRGFAELNGTPSSRALSCRIRQLKSLLQLEVRKTLDLNHAAIEHILLALLLDCQQSPLDSEVRNSMHKITQCDARLHFARKLHQDGLRHVQRHDASGRGKRHQTRSSWERNPKREPGVRISPGAHRIRNQHSVQPRVNNPVTRTERNAPSVVEKLGQSLVGLHVNWLRIGSGVAE